MSRNHRFQSFQTPIFRLKTALSSSTHPRHSNDHYVEPTMAPLSSSSLSPSSLDSSISPLTCNSSIYTPMTSPMSPISVPSSTSLSLSGFSPTSIGCRLSQYTAKWNSNQRLDTSGDRHGIRSLLILRRKPSSRAIEMEEEQRSFGIGLDVLEPRPAAGVEAGGIFEVLDGKV